MNRYRPKDRSGAITTAKVAQVLMSANAGRAGVWIQNLSTEDLYVCELGDAAPHQPSMRIYPGQLYEWHNEGVPIDAISIYGAVAGQQFSAREW